MIQATTIAGCNRSKTACAAAAHQMCHEYISCIESLVNRAAVCFEVARSYGKTCALQMELLATDHCMPCRARRNSLLPSPPVQRPGLAVGHTNAPAWLQLLAAAAPCSAGAAGAQTSAPSRPRGMNRSPAGTNHGAHEVNGVRCTTCVSMAPVLG